MELLLLLFVSFKVLVGRKEKRNESEALGCYLLEECLEIKLEWEGGMTEKFHNARRQDSVTLSPFING